MGYIITIELWGCEVIMMPERDHRYDVHKSAVYPFECVAQEVAARLPSMAHWPAYKVKAVNVTGG